MNADTNIGTELLSVVMERQSTTTTRLYLSTSNACSQAIDTLVFFPERDPESLALALKVAQWTIANMQDHNRLLLLSPLFQLAGK